MATVSGSSVPFGPGSSLVTDVSDGPGVRWGNGRRTVILGLAAAAVIVAGVAGVQYARTNSEASAVTPVSPLTKAMQVRDVYAPGGSVYDSQVPAAARAADLSVYGPGGSVYDSQVPAAGSPVDLSVFAPGGSVYDSQVPGR